MPIVIGVDPGPDESAIVAYDGESNSIVSARNVMNDLLLEELKFNSLLLAIEQVRGYGLKADNGLIDTVWWSGRFFECNPGRCMMIPRKNIVSHICDNRNAGDPEVSKALIDRIGPKGTKKAPGPTYGMEKHKWAALAVAVTYYDLYASGKAVA